MSAIAPTTIEANSPRSQTRWYRKLTIHEILQLFSSVLLPLMLTVFTIIITIRQEQVAREQRLQDMNNSAQQRAEDRQMAQQQRDHDLKIAGDQRDQDDLIAQKQRELLEKQRQYELEIESTRYDKEHEKHLDTLLLTYINEIGTLLLNNNGSLTANSHVASFARAKTLATTRLLDPTRNIQIIEFLYESGQLTNGRNPLDLSKANFNSIRFQGRHGTWPMHLSSIWI